MDSKCNFKQENLFARTSRGDESDCPACLPTRKLERTYAVVSAINQLIVREGELQVILEGACRIAVEKGDFRMAWIGMLVRDNTGQVLKPVASAGVSRGYLEFLRINLADPRMANRPSVRAALSGESQVCNDIPNCSPEPWHCEALARDYRSAVAFPLKIAGRTVGIFGLFAAKDLFDVDELSLLDEMALNISFTLENFQRKQEQREAVEKLRASEERFRQLAETIDEVFWIYDLAKERVIYVSPAYEKIWGRSCQSLYEEPRFWLETVHPEDRERMRLAFARQRVGEPSDETFRILRPDSQIRWIRETAFPVHDAAGQVERVVGAARDMTEHYKIAEELRHAQKMEAIGLLAGGVAHDFNNILGAMILESQLMASTPDLPAEIRDGLREIRSAAARAADLTSQLLLFSRKQIMQPRLLDLNECVRSLAKMLQRVIGEDVHLQLNLDSSPLPLRADAGMLDQVLMNLAVNSRDAMPAGGRLLIETCARDLDAQTDRLQPDAARGPHVCLRVTDNGEGIPPEVLPRIFEPFFTTKEPGKGTGLGLATVFSIVKQHGGFISVESQPGQATSFSILLPAAEPAPARDVTLADSEMPGGNETILLVEDDEMIRLPAKTTLERQGYRVIEAANGIEALKLWKESPSAISLLLTDLVMPAGISGMDLARELLGGMPQLKVIFTSGYRANISSREFHLEPGENFLQKPFLAEQLLATVRRRLDQPAAIPKQNDRA